MNDNSESELEEMVNELKNSDSRIKKIFYTSGVIFYGGLLGPKSQKRFAEKIGWQEKNLTISNAAFGIGTSVLFYFGGDYIGDIGGLEYIQNFQNAAVSWTADAVGITAKTILYTHAAFDGAQSLVRIVYAMATNESVPSISISGLLGNSIQYFISKPKKACGGS